MGLCVNVTSRTEWKRPATDGSVLYTGKIDPRGIPSLRELKRSIRTYIPWRRIDEIVSAQEFYEEAELQRFSDGLENVNVDSWTSGPKTAAELKNPLDEGEPIDENLEKFDE
jgi:hypothetical protein